MPGKMARSDPRLSVRVTQGAGSGQHLASVLKEGRENANSDAGLGFIWRISANVELGRGLVILVNRGCLFEKPSKILIAIPRGFPSEH
jgi:hypothetical protein